MTRRLNGDLTILAIGLLLVLQATFASYGVSVVRDIANTTHTQLAAVAKATR